MCPTASPLAAPAVGTMVGRVAEELPEVERGHIFRSANEPEDDAASELGDVLEDVVERVGIARGLDRYFGSAPAGYLGYCLVEVVLRGVDGVGRAEFPGVLKTVVLEIHGDDLARTGAGGDCGE